MIKLPDVGSIAVSVIPLRNINTVKIHKTLGHAKAAVQVHTRYCGRYPDNWDEITVDAQIYNIVDGDWNLLYDIKAGTRVDDLPWKKEK